MPEYTVVLRRSSSDRQDIPVLSRVRRLSRAVQQILLVLDGRTKHEVGVFDCVSIRCAGVIIFSAYRWKEEGREEEVRIARCADDFVREQALKAAPLLSNSFAEYDEHYQPQAVAA